MLASELGHALQFLYQIDWGHPFLTVEQWNEAASDQKVEFKYSVDLNKECLVSSFAEQMGGLHENSERNLMRWRSLLARSLGDAIVGREWRYNSKSVEIAFYEIPEFEVIDHTLYLTAKFVRQ